VSLAAQLAAAERRLAQAGVPSPRVDAELIAAHIWGVSRGRLRALALAGWDVDDGGPSVAGSPALGGGSGSRAERFAAAVSERARRVPLQHITGVAPFRGVDLAVGPGVFIPRPETELTAGLAIEAALAIEAPLVVDLGTGSGAIAGAVAREVPGARVVAVESDPRAGAWAARNLAGLGVTLLLADATEESWAGRWLGMADVVVSNPPYIPDGATPLEPEVALHDPPGALWGGGADGLQVPAAIVGVAARLLRTGGTLIQEHGAPQGEAMRGLAGRNGFAGVRTHRDLAGRDRVLSAVRAGWPGEAGAATQVGVEGSAG
jgi:release factor glutamine methyltransferase